MRNPIDIRCVTCGASPGVSCHTVFKLPRSPHDFRVVDAAAPPPRTFDQSQIPIEVLKAADQVHKYFAERGIQEWSLMNIRNRF